VSFLEVQAVSTSSGLRVGGLLKDGAYRVVSCDDRRIVVERVASGKLVSVTRKMIEKVQARLDAGESIPFRKISYTVAIETVVLAVLDRVVVDTVKKVYRVS